MNCFGRVCPTLVLTHPREDYMMDHEQTHLLARAGELSVRGAELAADTDRRGRGESAASVLLRSDRGIDPRGLRVTPTTYVDVTAVHPTKLRMLSCHASQRAWLRAHHGMDEYLDGRRPA